VEIFDVFLLNYLFFFYFQYVATIIFINDCLFMLFLWGIPELPLRLGVVYHQLSIHNYLLHIYSKILIWISNTKIKNKSKAFLIFSLPFQMTHLKMLPYHCYCYCCFDYYSIRISWKIFSWQHYYSISLEW